MCICLYFNSEKPKEVQPPAAPTVSENQNVLIPIIPASTLKKELVES